MGVNKKCADAKRQPKPPGRLRIAPSWTATRLGFNPDVRCDVTQRVPRARPVGCFFVAILLRFLGQALQRRDTGDPLNDATPADASRSTAFPGRILTLLRYGLS